MNQQERVAYVRRELLAFDRLDYRRSASRRLHASLSMIHPTAVVLVDCLGSRLAAIKCHEEGGATDC